MFPSVSAIGVGEVVARGDQAAALKAALDLLCVKGDYHWLGGIGIRVGGKSAV